MLQSRYTVFLLCLLLTVAGLISTFWWDGGWIVFLVFGFFALVGVNDILQKHHTIQRNYPVIGHIRWMV